KQLKANPNLADIPVIMMTTRDHAEDALNGLELGALDYIPKDAFADAVLLETIKQMAIRI
ncbi:MAG: response regulator, partial [Chloroflexota bacterium]